MFKVERRIWAYLIVAAIGCGMAAKAALGAAWTSPISQALLASSLGYDPQNKSGGQPMEARPDCGNDRRDDGRHEGREGRDDNDARFRPPGGNDNRWHLGVGIDVLDVGVRVTGVQYGSPAAQVGIETGDIIVNVGGHQVGRLADRIIDIGDALNDAADAQGRVRLLLQDLRTRNLIPVDVRLSRGGLWYGPGGGNQVNAVTGLINVREPTVLPANSELRVRLVQRGEWFNSQKVINERSYILTNRQLPVEFEVPFDPNDMSNRADYAIEAEISLGGRRMWATSQGYLVLTKGHDSKVEVWLDRAR